MTDWELPSALGLQDEEPITSFYYDGTEPLRIALSALSIPCDRPVLVLAGRAKRNKWDRDDDAQRILLDTAVAALCRDTEAVVISGGTNAGIMAVLGKSMAEFAPDTVLVGVAPHLKLKGHGASEGDADAEYAEPRHRMIRTSGDVWGSEGQTLVRVAEGVASGRPIVMLVIGGGKGTAREIALAARRRWPVVLLTGCGGESEATAVRLRLFVPEEKDPFAPKEEPGSVTGVGDEGPEAAKTSRRQSAAIDPEIKQANEELEDARADGCFISVPVCDGWNVERALQWRLSDNWALREAWTRFAAADLIAIKSKPPIMRLAMAVLVSAVTTVFFAGLLASSAQQHWFVPGTGLDVRTLSKLAITILPLAAALILVLIERRSRSGTWIERRLAAESILREIYRARAGSGVYADVRNPWMILSESVSRLDARLAGRVPARTDGEFDDTWPPPGLLKRPPPADTLLGPLTAASYDAARVRDQLVFMDGEITTNERIATGLAAALFIASAITATLLAVSWRWDATSAAAPVIAAVGAALISWREYLQLDTKSDAFRQTSVEVRRARGDWQALGASERDSHARLSEYVNEVEDAMAAEGSHWERSLKTAQENFVKNQNAG